MTTKNILLVDDDPVSNLVASSLLQRIEAVNEIHSVLNGVSAIRFLQEACEKHDLIPDLILLDLNMPLMDGFEFLDACGKLNLPNIKKIKFIVVTSSDNPDDIGKARKMGVSGYITKPVSEDLFRKALSAIPDV